MGDVTSILFPKFDEDNGYLCVYESGKHVPFQVRRVFTVSAKKGDLRGGHAHRQCMQLLVCLSGKIRVVCDNGLSQAEHRLEGMGSGLLIPHGIWASQEYLVDDAILMVLCDRQYEVEDYIRDYVEFKTFLTKKGSN